MLSPGTASVEEGAPSYTPAWHALTCWQLGERGPSAVFPPVVPGGTCRGQAVPGEGQAGLRPHKELLGTGVGCGGGRACQKLLLGSPADPSPGQNHGAASTREPHQRPRPGGPRLPDAGWQLLHEHPHYPPRILGRDVSRGCWVPPPLGSPAQLSLPKEQRSALKPVAAPARSPEHGLLAATMALGEGVRPRAPCCLPRCLVSGSLRADLPRR